jgi:hypothetical protein
MSNVEPPSGGNALITMGILTLAMMGGLYMAEDSQKGDRVKKIKVVMSEEVGGGTMPQQPTGSSSGSGLPPNVDPNMTGGPAGPGEGANRSWRGYVQTDVEALRAQLPPQAQHLAESFIAAGQTYNMDPLFLAAISQHETGNWTSNAFVNRNNAMGVSNASGVVNQASHNDSIMNMARSLAGASGTAGYYNSAQTVGQVGSIYAPIGAGNDPNGLNNYWAGGVGQFYDSFSRNLRGR